MNFRTAARFFAIALATSCGGCATVNAVDNIERGSPQHFVGTRVNMAAIAHDDEALRRFAQYSMYPARYPLLDLPFSLALDTIYFDPFAFR